MFRREHGTSLLEEVEQFVDTHSQRVTERSADVRQRLADLEKEHADLMKVLRKIEAVRATN